VLRQTGEPYRRHGSEASSSRVAGRADGGWGPDLPVHPAGSV